LPGSFLFNKKDAPSAGGIFLFTFFRELGDFSPRFGALFGFKIFGGRFAGIFGLSLNILATNLEATRGSST